MQEPTFQPGEQLLILIHYQNKTPTDERKEMTTHPNNPNGLDVEPTDTITYDTRMKSGWPTQKTPSSIKTNSSINPHIELGTTKNEMKKNE